MILRWPLEPSFECLSCACENCREYEDEGSRRTNSAAETATAKTPDDAESSAEAADELAGEDLEAFVADRYKQYWDEFDTARAAPSPNPSADYPALFSVAAGQQLDQTYADIIQLHDGGQAIREPDEPAIGGTSAADEHRVKVLAMEASVAELAGCVVNDDEHYLVETGNPFSNDGVRTIESTSTMAKTDGEWKLIRSQAVAIDNGIAGCWLDDSFE